MEGELDDQEKRAHDIAADIALAEIVRLLIGHVFGALGETEFRTTMAEYERRAIDSILSRPLFPGRANPTTEAFIKEAASGYITHLLTSVVHPKVDR